MTLARLVSLVVLGCPGMVAAQAPSPAPLVVSLERAMELARINNPEYRRASRVTSLNGPETRAAWASEVLPTLDVEVLQTGYAGNLLTRATDDFGNPIANPDADYVYFSSTRQGVALSWHVRGPRTWHRARRIGVENRGRRLREEFAAEVLRLDVSRRFFEALEQEELLAVEEAMAGARGSDLEAAERRFEVALGRRVDVLQAALEIERGELAVRSQRGARDRARLALAAVLGETGPRPVSPADTPLPLLDPVGLDETALVERARASSARVRRAEADLVAADLVVGESRATYWPEVRADLRVGRLVHAPGTGGMFDLGRFGGGELYSSFGFQVSLPFFHNPLASQAMVARARVAREDRRDDAREARIEATRATRSALLALRARWDRLQISERSLEIAHQILELAREEFRLGTEPFEGLQLAIVNAADLERGAIRTRYAFVDAIFDLEAAVGGPL